MTQPPRLRAAHPAAGVRLRGRSNDGSTSPTRDLSPLSQATARLCAGNRSDGQVVRLHERESTGKHGKLLDSHSDQPPAEVLVARHRLNSGPTTGRGYLEAIEQTWHFTRDEPRVSHAASDRASAYLAESSAIWSVTHWYT